jgi:hypothetical protein
MKFLETAKHLEVKSPTLTIPYLDHELKGKNELELVAKIKHVQLETYTIKSSINESAMEDLKMFHAVDGESMVKSVLESESLVNRQKKLSGLYKELGEISENELLSKWQKTIKKIFPSIKYKKYLTNPFKEGSDLLVRSIIMNSNLIVERSKRGGADFILCGRAVATLIQDSPNFNYNDINTISLSNGNEINSIGNINGRISIFVDNNIAFSDNTIILGRITRENETGVYIVEDTSAREIIETSNWEGSSMIKKILLIERLAFASMEKSHRNFIKFEVAFSRKPLWRKIFNL